ncbi:hypothetical protein, partial [Waltera sp.]|uniref:hypothetical protein n=1 Tax=Waltera sp. TaxID=2815806 RepID=UPI00307C0522
ANGCPVSGARSAEKTVLVMSRKDDSPECEWLSGFGSTECGENGISQKQEGRLTCRSTRREDN